jgi:hypothetical protein
MGSLEISDDERRMRSLAAKVPIVDDGAASAVINRHFETYTKYHTIDYRTAPRQCLEIDTRRFRSITNNRRKILTIQISSTYVPSSRPSSVKKKADICDEMTSALV